MQGYSEDNSYKNMPVSLKSLYMVCSSNRYTEYATRNTMQKRCAQKAQLPGEESNSGRPGRERLYEVQSIFKCRKSKCCSDEVYWPLDWFSNIVGSVDDDEYGEVFHNFLNPGPTYDSPNFVFCKALNDALYW